MKLYEVFVREALIKMFTSIRSEFINCFSINKKLL